MPPRHGSLPWTISEPTAAKTQKQPVLVQGRSPPTCPQPKAGSRDPKVASVSSHVATCVKWGPADATVHWGTMWRASGLTKPEDWIPSSSQEAEALSAGKQAAVVVLLPTNPLVPLRGKTSISSAVNITHTTNVFKSGRSHLQYYHFGTPHPWSAQQPRPRMEMYNFVPGGVNEVLEVMLLKYLAIMQVTSAQGDAAQLPSLSH